MSVSAENREKLLSALVELLELDGPLNGTEKLANFETWDSLAVISLISFCDEEFDKILSGNDILKATTANDLVELLGK